ncbi:TPA: glycosyltransferase family 2 protein, partial [Campylobacter lari]|nr:glycosyltransferase family 2 protein [Campylobacter lari]
MQTKKVGVVIPIYNVEKYLKECLDSVINQTYTNLEIILVNDGSTDENSLNIAKEYTLKDKRITLFDKKNGGQSSARNVGIEYFSGEYKLKNKTQTIKENSLIEFNIEGNNPYEIYTVYKSYKAFNNEQDLTSFTYPIIDYIIFLDSDDYWELNCIEECVPRMDGVDVLWFDYKVKNEITDYNLDWTYHEIYNFKDKKITPIEWLNRYFFIKTKIPWFAFAWQGMINFDFLKNIKLKFINGIIHEDIHFGMLLFSYVSYIYVLNNKIYIYRIRDNSTCDYNEANNIQWLPNYLKDIFIYFNYDIKQTKEYHRIYSEVKSIQQILFFTKNNKNKIYKNKIFIDMLNHRIEYMWYLISTLTCDPLKIYKEIPKKLYIKRLNELHKQNNLYKAYSQHGTAKQRIQNQLSYKLGQTFIINSKTILGILLIPIFLFATIISHKQEQKKYRIKIKKDPLLKLPPLEEYPDYEEAIKFKNHLSYQLGQTLIHSFKFWYKGKI